MKTLILFISLVLGGIKSHAQTGWYDEEESKIPDHFARYDTATMYLFDTTKSTIYKVYKITKHTHYFPAITIEGSPVYWTIWWRIVSTSFQPMKEEGILLIPTIKLENYEELKTKESQY